MRLGLLLFVQLFAFLSTSVCWSQGTITTCGLPVMTECSQVIAPTTPRCGKGICWRWGGSLAIRCLAGDDEQIFEKIATQNFVQEALVLNPGQSGVIMHYDGQEIFCAWKSTCDCEFSFVGDACSKKDPEDIFARDWVCDETTCFNNN
jgi:hypothetical protein